MKSESDANPEPVRRPHRAVGAGRKDNIVLAKLLTASYGRTVRTMVERLIDDHAWATHDNVYTSLLRLVKRGLIVRESSPVGMIYAAAVPDPDDSLEQAFAADAATEVDLPTLNANDRVHKTRRDIYTHDEIIAAILRYADDHDGEPPRQAFWSPALCRRHARRHARIAVGWLQAIADYDAHDYPSEQTVRKYFGSWNAALAAAGFHEQLRSSGGQGRESDLTIISGVGAANNLERLLEGICSAHHTDDTEKLRSTLLDLSFAARDWAMQIDRRLDIDAPKDRP